MTLTISDLLQHPDPPVSAIRATIANTPELGGELYVTVGAFDGDRQVWGPCRWVPSNGIPAAGDECLLVLTEEDGTPWVMTTAAAASGGGEGGNVDGGFPDSIYTPLSPVDGGGI
jgi:hypothetical protein